MAASDWPPRKVTAVCRVVVAAEIGIYADALAVSLGHHGHEVGAIAPDAVRTLQAVREHAPDVLLLDVAMPAALATLRVVAAEHPHVRVLALAVEETEAIVIACAEAGVAGYVPRDVSVAEVAAMVREAARGEATCSPRIAARLLHRVAVLAAGRAADAAPDTGLTPRETEILALIDDGLSNKQIALRLCIEVATVKNHVHNILNKLQVSRRGEAAAMVRAARLDGALELTV